MRRLYILFLFTIHYSLFTNICCAQPIPAGELIEQAEKYDGKIVEYEGELIGGPLARKNGAWFNLLDDSGAALGVWVKKDIIPQVDYQGGYRVTGDYFAVRGRFRKSCLRHGGDLDIHAAEITKIRAGKSVAEDLPRDKQRLALYLGAMLGGVWIISLILRKRRKSA